MSNVIKPTVGRKVWYRPSAAELNAYRELMTVGDQPFDATIIAVFGDSRVNLDICDAAGNRFVRHHVQLVQDGDQIYGHATNGYAEWMPYQTKAAAREPALDAAAAAHQHIAEFQASGLHPVRAGIVPLDAQGVAVTGAVGGYLAGKTDHHPV